MEDLKALKDIEGITATSLIETLKMFAAQEQRFDAIRTMTYGRLNHLSRQIIQDTQEWREMGLEEKCRIIGEIQECFYDFQLIEHASQQPLLTLAGSIFALNKRRCVGKAPLVKSKPSKKQKLDHALIRDIRRSEREIKSPSFISKFPLDRSSNSKNKTDEERDCNNDRDTPMNPDANDDKDDCFLSERDIVDTADKRRSSSRVASPALDCIPPRRRAAALAAAVSVAETVNPQRGSSPRKRNTAANNHNADDDADSVSTQDEPRYCLCNQISYGDMICCDYPKCKVEWFHFSCVFIKIKPKGKKWFCPLCRGDKPTVLKPSLQSRR